MLKKALPAFKVVVTLTLLVTLFHKVDYEYLISILTGVKKAPLAAAILSSAAAVAVSSWRWSIILNVQSISCNSFTILKYTFVGNFFNQILPSSIGGDAFRIAALCYDKVSLGASTKSVLAERLTGSIVLVFWSAITLIFLEPYFGTQWNGVIHNIMLFLPALIFLLLLFFLTIGFLRAKSSKIYAVIGDFLGFLNFIFSQRSAAIALVVMSFLGQILGASTIFCIGVSLGAPITLIETILVMPSVYLLLTIPLSVGGWGAREALLVFALGAFGTTAAHAILIGVIYGVIKLIVSIPSLLFWLFKRQAKY